MTRWFTLRKIMRRQFTLRKIMRRQFTLRKRMRRWITLRKIMRRWITLRKIMRRWFTLRKVMKPIFQVPIFLWELCIWIMIMRLCISEKIPSSDDFANILELMYTLKILLSKTTITLESWFLLTVWPASSSQQSVLPLISLVVFLLYVSEGVVTS
jgi:hypothetical protein